MRALLTAARLIYGSLLLLAPGVLVAELSHRRIDRRTRLVARTLGVRNLVEAAVLSRRHSRAWLLAGAATDGAHAATMAALAALDRRRRPLASRERARRHRIRGGNRG
jgi:hypothetical protein